MDEDTILVGNVVSWKDQNNENDEISVELADSKDTESAGCTCDDWCGRDGEWDC